MISYTPQDSLSLPEEVGVIVCSGYNPRSVLYNTAYHRYT